ncbi:uncharacterized protein LOC143579744 [Bidens hawaiensis]|uniref:uncharacterized protein LOC143579744 n=1 Tax=Bidens hawaiensis TaxID=980011 RepID=UPI00404AF46B
MVKRASPVNILSGLSPVFSSFKKCAFKMLHGSMREHYSKLGSYLAALKEINPTSTFELVTVPPGFNNQEPGGMLLVAIGRDANDQMYPMAWAVVDGESNDSWEWFMEELRKCLDGGKDWTLVSDQQNGLVNAVSLIWKNSEHRNCARHIYACRAYNEPDFNDAIKEMRAISADAVEAFMKQNPNCFVRCFLKGHTSCDVIVSNMAETFNGTIVEARSMHIIDIGKKWAHKCTVFPSAYNVFQVKDFADDLAVDLNNRTCSCRKWNLAVAGFLGRNAEEFVHDCYLKEAYLRSYSYTIPPLPSERYWPRVDYPLDPPPIKSQPGRPKTKRKKDPHEDPKKPGKLTKHGGEMTCSNCKETGYNIRKCTKPKTSKNKATSKSGARGRSTRSTQATHESQPTQQSVGSKRPRGMTKDMPSQPTQQSTSSKRPRGNTKAKGKGKAT